MVQPLHDLSKHRVFAAVQMRRARSIDDNAHVRICCGDRRISQVPKRKAIERVRFGFCIVDDQLLYQRRHRRGGIGRQHCTALAIAVDHDERSLTRWRLCATGRPARVWYEAGARSESFRDDRPCVADDVENLALAGVTTICRKHPLGQGRHRARPAPRFERRGERRQEGQRVSLVILASLPGFHSGLQASMDHY